jgi:hypothetical protein
MSGNYRPWHLAQEERARTLISSGIVNLALTMGPGSYFPSASLKVLLTEQAYVELVRMGVNLEVEAVGTDRMLTGQLS